MQKVVNGDYHKFQKLFQNISWELSGLAVTAKINPGSIWTNDVNNPTSAFMASPEGYLIAGDPKNLDFNKKLKIWFEHKFLPWGLNENYNTFEIYFNPGWKEVALEIFHARKLISYQRRHYIINKSDWQPQTVDLSINMKLTKINSAFVEDNLNFRNMLHLKKWIYNNWGSYENFDNKGFAFAIIHKDIVASWSVADCCYQDKCEIGIHTDLKFTRKNMAHSVVQAMLKYAFTNSFTQIGWHCVESNIASCKTAQKSKFHLERKYTANYGFFNPLNH